MIKIIKIGELTPETQKIIEKTFTSTVVKNMEKTIKEIIHLTIAELKEQNIEASYEVVYHAYIQSMMD